jgi:hypothetical protein
VGFIALIALSVACAGGDQPSEAEQPATMLFQRS